MQTLFDSNVSDLIATLLAKIEALETRLASIEQQVTDNFWQDIESEFFHYGGTDPD